MAGVNQWLTLYWGQPSVDAMTATPMTVTDEQVADLEKRFGRAGVVELTYQIALENSRARNNHALGITAQGFGTDSCRVPWA